MATIISGSAARVARRNRGSLPPRSPRPRSRRPSRPRSARATAARALRSDGRPLPRRAHPWGGRGHPGPGIRPAALARGGQPAGGRRTTVLHAIALFQAQTRRAPGDRAVAVCTGCREREERQLVDQQRDLAAGDLGSRSARPSSPSMSPATSMPARRAGWTIPDSRAHPLEHGRGRPVRRGVEADVVNRQLRAGERASRRTMKGAADEKVARHVDGCRDSADRSDRRSPTSALRTNPAAGGLGASARCVVPARQRLDHRRAAGRRRDPRSRTTDFTCAASRRAACSRCR